MLEWEEYFEPHILERGRSYARRGAVKYISRHEDTIEAIVEGTEYYKVKIRFSGCRIAESYCSCPYAAGTTCCVAEPIDFSKVEPMRLIDVLAPIIMSNFEKLLC